MLLNVEHLKVEFYDRSVPFAAVEDFSLQMEEGEVVGVVGESGSGKSMTAHALMGLIRRSEVDISGRALFGGADLLSMSRSELRRYQGKELSIIFQEPMTSLNPTMKIGRQVEDALRVHTRLTGEERRARALEAMALAGLPEPEKLYACYPHQLSGGMRQRVMIAAALVLRPRLLIADEPTTALDVTIQAQIMELIRDMNKQMGTAVLLISHDLGVIRRMCSRVYIMYAGRVVESGTTQEVLAHPLHPYTKGLIASIPSLEKRGQRLSSIPGTVPALEDRSEHGCPFYNRCYKRRDACKNETPPMVVHKGHMALCVDAKEELGL